MSTPAGDDVDVAFREAQSYSHAGQRWGSSGAVAPHVAQQAIEQAECVNDGLIWQTNTNDSYSNTDSYYGSDMGDDGSLPLATLDSGYGGDEYNAPSGTGQSGSSAQGTVTYENKRGPVQVSKSSILSKAMWTCPCCKKTSSKKQAIVEHQSKHNHY
ncbi:hypothetical protein F5Y03DRAFT_388627 [Xylaria venustula]|nr:hypothetical protein F5Y03DRAFT_388627 [Xylaria venustula]